MNDPFDLGNPLNVDARPAQGLNHAGQRSRSILRQPNGQVAGHWQEIVRPKVMEHAYPFGHGRLPANVPMGSLPPDRAGGLMAAGSLVRRAREASTTDFLLRGVNGAENARRRARSRSDRSPGGRGRG